MADDNQREELNQSLACISDRHSQSEGKNCSCGWVSHYRIQIIIKKREYKTRDKK